ncbi:hypothetical protein [Seongchinamella sediminis]|uniref:hypothetical protein n=1 Tax=Seongchinamella sediminis TaxID=2283635 RepID=UPI0013C37419|nr:hypothetical protein [Seongchinamella sediminis]
MADLRHYAAQALLYAAFFLPIVYLTQQPSYRSLGPDQAVFKLAIRHAGKVIGECVPVSGADNANLPRNMKAPEICPRERSPLLLELRVDDRTLYRESVPPSGLHNDGVSSMYRRFTLPTGTHRIELTMNDDVSVDGPTWELQRELQLQPAQVVVATFKDGLRLQ